ncbi:MAG TPA: hypothetical protein VN088_08555 [Nocardioides sp.]|nr:hypothetical protein [Nocardioides sp.]
MSFAYDAGTSTPNIAGLVEVGPIRINDGTFELFAAHGLLLESADVRDAVTPFPYWHGGFAGAPFYGPLDISLEGQIKVPAVEDLWGAIDLLKQTFNLADPSLKTLTVNTAGWSAARQIAVRVSGPVQIESPGSDLDSHWRRRRGFTVPLIAPDPRLYAVTETSVTVTTGTAVTNVGTMNAPFKVRFNGPLTNPKIDLAGTTGTDRLQLLTTLTAGHWVEINTYDPTTGTLTAVDDTGADRYADVSAATARELPVGASSWTASADSGTGTTVVTLRSAWA